MAKKKGGTSPDEWRKTSLSVKVAVYKRAWHHKLESRRDLGEIVSEALDEYLKKRGA